MARNIINLYIALAITAILSSCGKEKTYYITYEYVESGLAGPFRNSTTDTIHVSSDSAAIDQAYSGFRIREATDSLMYIATGTSFLKYEGYTLTDEQGKEINDQPSRETANSVEEYIKEDLSKTILKQ